MRRSKNITRINKKKVAARKLEVKKADKLCRSRVSGKYFLFAVKDSRPEKIKVIEDTIAEMDMKLEVKQDNKSFYICLKKGETSTARSF